MSESMVNVRITEEEAKAVVIAIGNLADGLEDEKLGRLLETAREKLNKARREAQ